MNVPTQNFGVTLKHKLIQLGLTSSHCELAGCKVEDLEYARQRQGVTFLPELYVNFMLELGECAGGLFDNEVRYNSVSIRFLKDMLIDDIARLELPFQVPEDAFFFLGDAAVMTFWFFHTQDRNENPPVYIYLDEHQTAEKVSSSLTEFFDNWIEDIMHPRGSR